MSRDDALADRVREVMHDLPRKQGRLARAVHLKGVFASWTKDTAAESLVSAVRAQVPTRGNGQVWYLDDENHRPADLDLSQLSRGRTAAVLPIWAQRAQGQLLEELFDPASYGWSSVIFITEDLGATVGEHVDNEDVYTIQLCGSKHWVIDPPDLDWLRARALAGELARLNPSESWVRNRREVVPFRCPREFRVDAGDLLAMPAFSLHEVRALGPRATIAFNVSICQEQDWTA